MILPVVALDECPSVAWSVNTSTRRIACVAWLYQLVRNVKTGGSSSLGKHLQSLAEEMSAIEIHSCQLAAASA